METIASASRRRDRGSIEDKGCTAKIASCCQTFTQLPWAIARFAALVSAYFSAP